MPLITNTFPVDSNKPVPGMAVVTCNGNRWLDGPLLQEGLIEKPVLLQRWVPLAAGAQHHEMGHVAVKDEATLEFAKKLMGKKFKEETLSNEDLQKLEIKGQTNRIFMVIVPITQAIREFRYLKNVKYPAQMNKDGEPTRGEEAWKQIDSFEGRIDGFPSSHSDMDLALAELAGVWTRGLAAPRETQEQYNKRRAEEENFKLMNTDEELVTEEEYK